jgi:hypothetical protein
MKLPIETGKSGETVSLPTVQDYLKEICKEDNVDLNEYLAKTHTIKTLDTSLFTSYTNFKPVENSNLKNHSISYRFFSVWLTLKNIKYSGYHPFDFRTYQVCDTYTEGATFKSTPWNRFKKFIRNQWLEIKWAWNYTP